MSSRYDCADGQQREAGIVAAVAAVQEAALVVLPTDTVYGIGADAFSPQAVENLRELKGTGRNVPPQVLVGSVRAAAALAESLGAFGQDLIDEFWPGPLTLVFRASSTLLWDLGDTMGTVAVRMPMHPVALELLRRTGPMAVSSANKQGMRAATTAAEAEAELAEEIAVFLDGGPCSDNVPSTILDLTGTVPRVLRAGALSADALRKVVPVIDLPETAGGAPDMSPADRRAEQAIAAAAQAETAVPETAVPETAVPETGFAPESAVPETGLEAETATGPGSTAPETAGPAAELSSRPVNPGKDRHRGSRPRTVGTAVPPDDPQPAPAPGD